MVYNSSILDMTRVNDFSEPIQINEFGKMAIHSVGTGIGHGDIELSNDGINWKTDGSSLTNVDFNTLIILDSFPWHFIRFVSRGTGTGTLTMLISIKQ